MPESRRRTQRVRTGAFNTVDFSMAASTAQETYTRSRKSKDMSPVTSKVRNFNRAILSRSTQGVPQAKVQIKKFSTQSIQIYSDLELIHRRIDEGEIKLDVDHRKRSLTAISDDGRESLAKQALKANENV